MNMKKILLIAGIELIFSFITSLMINEGTINYDFMTFFGAVNLVLSVVGIIAGIVFLLLRKRETGLNIIVSAGIMLLIGAGTCSIFLLNLK